MLRWHVVIEYPSELRKRWGGLAAHAAIGQVKFYQLLIGNKNHQIVTPPTDSASVSTVKSPQLRVGYFWIARSKRHHILLVGIVELRLRRGGNA